MDIDLARLMVRTAFENGARLQELLPLLKQQCSPDDYRRHAHQIAEAIDKTNVSLISSALAEHPQLEAEIETSIGATGRYR